MVRYCQAFGGIKLKVTIELRPEQVQALEICAASRNTTVEVLIEKGVREILVKMNSTWWETPQEAHLREKIEALRKR